MTQLSIRPHKIIPTEEFLRLHYPEVQTFFFDMDGTLFNTEKFHEDALIQMANEHKIKSPHSPESLHKLMMGKADHLVYEIARDWENFPKDWSVQKFVATKNQILLDMLVEDSDQFFDPVFRQTLHNLKDSGAYIGLITSSEKVITHKLIEMANISHLLNLILTRDDCPEHKPSPWPYLEALRLTNKKAHEVLIFEDSEVGLTAAKLSGAHVIKAEWY